MKSLFVIVHVYMCVLIQSNEINIQTLVSKHKSEVIHKSQYETDRHDKSTTKKTDNKQLNNKGNTTNNIDNKIVMNMKSSQGKRLSKQLNKISQIASSDNNTNKEKTNNKPYLVLNLLDGLKSWFSGEFAFTNYQPSQEQRKQKDKNRFKKELTKDQSQSKTVKDSSQLKTNKDQVVLLKNSKEQKNQVTVKGQNVNSVIIKGIDKKGNDDIKARLVKSSKDLKQSQKNKSINPTLSKLTHQDIKQNHSDNNNNINNNKIISHDENTIQPLMIDNRLQKQQTKNKLAGDQKQIQKQQSLDKAVKKQKTNVFQYYPVTIVYRDKHFKSPI